MGKTIRSHDGGLKNFKKIKPKKDKFRIDEYDEYDDDFDDYDKYLTDLKYADLYPEDD